MFIYLCQEYLTFSEQGPLRGNISIVRATLQTLACAGGYSVSIFQIILSQILMNYYTIKYQ